MAEDRIFDEALRALLQEDDGVNPNAPISIDQQIEKKKEEYKEYLKFEPLQEKIKYALEVIQEELVKELSEEEKEMVLEDLADAGVYLKDHPEAQGEELGISIETLTILYEFAGKKLTKNEVKTAASLFTLLTILDSSWYRYWYFLGVSLQELKEYKEAIKAYSKAKEISQESPLCNLYMAECYLGLLDKEKATFHVDKAKKIMSDSSSNAEYDRLVDDLEAKILNM